MSNDRDKYIRYVVHQFSEWLDVEGLIVPPSDEDDRTHNDLVADFFGDNK